MSNEKSDLGRAIDQATAANETAQPVLLTFDPQARSELLHHYTGLAMSALIETSKLSSRALFGPARADEAVRIANETVAALERFYNLSATQVRGRG